MGKYIARVFAKHGALCVINGMDASGEDTAEELRVMSPGSFFVRCDMSDAQDVKNFTDTVLERCGMVDIVVNNVGINRSDPTCAIDNERFEYTQQVNLRSILRLARAFLPGMLNRGGVFLHISSIHSQVAVPNNTAYASSKSGMEAFSRALAARYGSLGIRSNVICPGGIFTGGMDKVIAGLGADEACYRELRAHCERRQPDYGNGSPYDIAHTALFLCSRMGSRVNGATVMVDGGAVKQAHVFYERRLPPDCEERWRQTLLNKFTPVFS